MSKSYAKYASFATVVTAAVLFSVVSLRKIRKDRWAMLRCHPWKFVRRMYQSVTIYHFAWRIERAYHQLPLPIDELHIYPGSSSLLDSILACGPDTYQKKPSNRAQIASLLNCICNIVPQVKNSLILDIGAGKALLTRAVYEALDRRTAVVALDSRRPSKKDDVYDPTPNCQLTESESSGECSDQDLTVAPYIRVVADVHHLAARTIEALESTGTDQRGVLAITKHLCGGATDGSLMTICAPPLADYVGACCLVPCCHQKLKREEYCNLPYLESLGFCQTHVGVRGGVQDNDFKIFGMLISMSKHNSRDSTGKENAGQFKKSILLQVLGWERACRLGRMSRRLLEEGRMQYLEARGFNVHLVRYCDSAITGDNLAIIAKRI